VNFENAFENNTVLVIFLVFQINTVRTDFFIHLTLPATIINRFI